MVANHVAKVFVAFMFIAATSCSTDTDTQLCIPADEAPAVWSQAGYEACKTHAAALDACGAYGGDAEEQCRWVPEILVDQMTCETACIQAASCTAVKHYSCAFRTYGGGDGDSITPPKQLYNCIGECRKALYCSNGEQTIRNAICDQGRFLNCKDGSDEVGCVCGARIDCPEVFKGGVGLEPWERCDGRVCPGSGDEDDCPNAKPVDCSEFE
jgi:hypothetical protein